MVSLKTFAKVQPLEILPILIPSPLRGKGLVSSPLKGEALKGEGGGGRIEVGVSMGNPMQRTSETGH